MRPYRRNRACGRQIDQKPYPLKLRVGNRIAMEARKRGVIIRPLGDTIVIMPCLSIKESELRELMKAVYDSTKK